MPSSVRFAYNKALHIKKHAYQWHGVNLYPRKDLKPLLAVAKKSRRNGWLKEYDSIALQQAVINLDVAFCNFFNPKLKTRFPAFKRSSPKRAWGRAGRCFTLADPTATAISSAGLLSMIPFYMAYRITEVIHCLRRKRHHAYQRYQHYLQRLKAGAF